MVSIVKSTEAHSPSTLAPNTDTSVALSSDSSTPCTVANICSCTTPTGCGRDGRGTGGCGREGSGDDSIGGALDLNVQLLIKPHPLNNTYFLKESVMSLTTVSISTSDSLCTDTPIVDTSTEIDFSVEL